jgi:hypothetical protein
VEDIPLQLPQEYKGKTFPLLSIGPLVLLVTLSERPQRRLLKEDAKPGIRALRQVEYWPCTFGWISNIQLVGMGMTLRVRIKELTQKRAARALNLRNENQWLVHFHEMLQSDIQQVLELLSKK